MFSVSRFSTSASCLAEKWTSPRTLQFSLVWTQEDWSAEEKCVTMIGQINPIRSNHGDTENRESAAWKTGCNCLTNSLPQPSRCDVNGGRSSCKRLALRFACF
jgi:hypothetical protein